MRVQNAQGSCGTQVVSFSWGNAFSGLRISQVCEAGPPETTATPTVHCTVQPADRAGPPQEVRRGTKLGTRGCPRWSHPEKNSVSHETNGIVLALDRSFAVAAPRGGRIEVGRFQDPLFPTVPVAQSARPTVSCSAQQAWGEPAHRAVIAGPSAPGWV